jgi:putrescine transport system permease protein
MNRVGVILPPLLWLLAFFAAPFAIIVAISLATATDGAPPFEIKSGLSLEAYRLLVSDTLYIGALLTAIRIAATAALICLLIGYPLAYAIAEAPKRWRGVLLLFVILPFWTSFLIRIYAWITLLRPTGLINSALMALGVIDEPLALMANEFGVLVGIVYCYLPFMVLPLYVGLERVDPALREAAADLGAPPWQVFRAVTLPLTRRAIIAGLLLVFIPAVGEFVIPDLLGGPDAPMIGRVVWMEFFANRDWPAASALSVALLVVVIGPLVLVQRFLGSRGEPL